MTAGWYRNAIIYEVHVRAFKDSDGDGIGDFKGLVQKLDYIQDLGVTAIWLLPFYPSPLKDDGYDIADYMSIHPAYGTLRDFKLFLREAHRQGLKVITELVLNHTSDQHPWFQRARRAPSGSAARDYYVWSPAPDRYGEARIIFKDFESSNWSFDPATGQYYWHRFYSHQPDLNWDSPSVRRSMLQVVDFWLEMGVDGLRLDAVPYLFERDQTNCENLPETHQALKDLRRHVDGRFSDRMLLAEANQWPEDAISYFGKGDECNMAFHFPLMPRMFMALRMEDRFPIIDILSQTPPIPEGCQWALFLRNHDELTLEMVTDEDRDYMYRMYAQDPQARINLGIRRRLAPLLGNNRRMIELINGLLFSLPGTPVLYYGDEIGMGDNIYLGDRNGVRTPMQWSAGRNAGFSEANPQRLFLPVIIDPEYHAEALNVEAQQQNPHSLLWWTKRMVDLRKRFRAFGEGSLEFIYPDNRKILAFQRVFEDERVLVVMNFSRFAQYVELDLSPWAGMQPVELFGGVEFPPVGDSPYLLTLGPHAFYWFSLQPQRRGAPSPVSEARLPLLEVEGSWDQLLSKRGRPALEGALPAFLLTRRWFGGKARRIRSVTVDDAIPVEAPQAPAEAKESRRERRGTRDGGIAGYLTIISVEYVEGDPEVYLLPLAATRGRRSGEREHLAPATLARLKTSEGDLVLYDAAWNPSFCRLLLEAVGRRRRVTSGGTKLLAVPAKAFRQIRGREGSLPAAAPISAEQSNTSVMFGDRIVMKLLRRLEPGMNPDLELGRFLTEQAGFAHMAPLAGSLEYVRGKDEAMTLAILHAYEANEGDAWRYTIDSLKSFAELMLARVAEGAPAPPELESSRHLLDLARSDPSPVARETIGHFLERAELLGERSAQMHLALASRPGQPGFEPEDLTPFHQRSLFESMRTLTRRVFQSLRNRSAEIPEAVQVLDLEEAIVKRFRELVDTKITADLIRCHGDYHLGQVLFTGKDFVIIDFEGEPARSLTDRRRKRSPLIDVAGMLRSLHYAAYSLLYGFGGGVVRLADPTYLEPWLRFWYLHVGGAFLRSYLKAAGDAPFLPAGRRELEILLDSFLLEKATYELGYEASHRPEWIKLPIQGVLQLLSE